MTTRLADPADTEAVTTLLKEWMTEAPTPGPDIRPWIDRVPLSGTDAPYWTFLAHRGGELVGVAGYGMAIDTPRSCATVEFIYVSPCARRRGVGSELLDAMETHADANEAVGMLRIEVPTAVAPALDFFESRGWLAVPAAYHFAKVTSPGPVAVA